MSNLILASFFTPEQTTILIVVSVVGVLLIILNIVLAYIFHRRGERKLFTALLQQQRVLLNQQLANLQAGNYSEEELKLKAFFAFNQAPATAVEPEDTEPEEEPVIVEDEETEIVEEVVVDGVVIRYNRSFTARLSQSSDLLKSRYSELKNYILSYKGVKCRTSWKRESFRFGRPMVACFVIRGKSLCLCLALDPKQFEETKYKVVDLSIRSPKSKTPCMYRITNDRRVRYAKELIDLLLVNLGALYVEHTIEDYMIPYETTEVLIKRDLIRIIGNSNLPASNEEVETPTVVDQVENKEEAVEVLTDVEEEEDTDTDEELVINGQVIRYNRSFTARLIQSSDEVKNRYSELKNYLLSFKKMKRRISWKKESFYFGKSIMANFVIRGKTLCLCIATDPKQFEETKYKVVDLSIRSPKSKTPCMYRITSDRKVKYAKQLLDEVFAKQNLTHIEKSFEDFTVPYETVEELIQKGMIRVSMGNSGNSFIKNK